MANNQADIYISPCVLDTTHPIEGFTVVVAWVQPGGPRQSINIFYGIY